MRFFYKLLRQNPDSREGIILTTSALSMIISLLLAVVKILLGTLTRSIAILSEGINNAADTLSSVLTIVGTKLSGMRRTKKHPFGFGRIEYLTSMLISGVILFAGFEFLQESVRHIFHPEQLELSAWVLIVIAASAAIKLALGTYIIRMGRRAESGALVAVGTESRNDSILSAVTLVSTLVYLIFHLSVDAYAGVLTSLFILKAGFDLLKDTVSRLLGQSADKTFADKIYREIRATDGVLNAADMMLHNYGPDAYSGSVNLEIDHARSVGEVYEQLHALQLRILREYKVTMVFGLYAVDNARPELKALRREIAGFVRDHAHALSYHALYLNAPKKEIYCDLVVDYEERDYEALEREFAVMLHRTYPEHAVHLVVETEYV